MRKKTAEKLLSKLPSHIKITSKVSYEVVYIPEFADKKTLGECRPDVKQIVICSNQNPNEIVKVLLHEITHAVAIENEFDLTEKQVLALEEGFFAVIDKNKLFDVLARLC